MIKDCVQIENKLSDSIYTFRKPFKYLGCQIGNRMTVIKLPDQKLWVHSAIQATESILSFLSNVGHVEHIVAPNLFHYLHLKSFVKYFPNASRYSVPGLEKKQTLINYNLSENLMTWSPVIESKIIRGIPKLNEVVFFHRESKTLILTDLLFNLTNNSGLSKFLLKLDGIDGQLAFSTMNKLMIKDKSAFIESIQSIYDWEFENIIMSHGEIIQGNAREKFKLAFSFIDLK